MLPKKTPALLSLFTGVSLVALWLERYLLIVPSVTGKMARSSGSPNWDRPCCSSGSSWSATGSLPDLPDGFARLAEITIDGERVTHAGEFLHEEGAGTVPAAMGAATATLRPPLPFTGPQTTKPSPGHCQEGFFNPSPLPSHLVDASFIRVIRY